jgi:glycosyltransferase involved in cell wall biosynthesis
MNIALIGPAFPLRGGIADFNEALARALEKAGHRVRVHSFYLQYPRLLFPGKTQLASADTPAPGLDIRATIGSVQPWSWWRTARAVSEFQPDLVIVRYWLPFMAPALGTICRRLRRQGIRVIAITDNILPHEQRPGDTALTRYFVRSCDAFVAMSRSVLEDLQRFTDNPHRRFLPHPVYDIFGPPMEKSDARRRLGIPEGQRLLLFFGFIRKYKGLDLLLEAMGSDVLKAQDVHLLVAGEFYESDSPYREILLRNGASARVRFDSDFIPKERVREYFCAADLVVQPYRHATQSGITQIAYHFGRPMLVTRVGGLAEIVEDGKTGYVTDPEPTAIASAISRYYSESKEAGIAQAVVAARARFDWSSFVQGVIQLYETIR